MEDENCEFKVEWTENFAFIQNLNGLPTCLICKEKFAHNKKSNLERHFTRKHASFSTKYPTGDARKKAVEKLQKSQELSTSVFNNWMQSSSNINMARFVFSQEIAKRGKPYTDGLKEDILGLLPFKGQMRGEDIANAVIECMDKHPIPFDKIVSISTDGAKKALCAQTFPDEIGKVMESVIIIINSILAKALNHRQFKEFLFEMESEYADLLLHNKKALSRQPPGVNEGERIQRADSRRGGR
ncbi:general transcription factor II-I repeat domain-containing protein 2B [Trichonephila clavipes]|nr:general transcription factor II-I repeat domain-containing protein 2B [Trichonephila clavipes]